MRFLLCLFILISCGGPTKPVFSDKRILLPIISEELKGSISYHEVNTKVFANKCLGCHDSGSQIQLDSYEKAYPYLQKIKKAVLLNKSMPQKPISQLDKKQLELVTAWIEAGGPNAPLNGSGVPDEPGPVLKQTFDSIKAFVLDRKCISCHSAGGSVARIPLVTKDDLLNSSLDIVVPGNPDDSGLSIVLEEGARKFMPPKKSGFTPVSEAEKEVIRQWILAGAP